MDKFDFKKYKIAVGAGHYPKHPGVVVEHDGIIIREHDCAKKLESILVRKLENYYMYRVYTFSGNLIEKVKTINETRTDIAIELHFNCCNAHGGEILYYPSMGSTLLAYNIGRYMKHYVSKWRGVKVGYYHGDPHKQMLYFLRKTKCPAVILEPGFLDSEVDIKLILDERWLNLIADSIIKGISYYYAERGE